MSVVETQYKNMKKFSIEQLLARVVKAEAETITQINREQMLDGQRGDGPITPLTANNQNPDLFDTGSFQKAMFTEVKGEKVLTSSKDNKTSDLESRYSKSIFDLNKDSQTKAQDIITPIFLEEFHTLINK